MIWILAGTGDSYSIITKLKNKYEGIIASVVTDYGWSRLADIDVNVIKKRLKIEDMRNLIKKYNIKLIIDATHPFAINVSKNAITASKEMSVRYIRYEREAIDLSSYSSDCIIPVNGYEEAVKKADPFKKIFLTIGSNKLDYFIKGIDNWEDRLIIRILPDWRFIKKARQAGFTPANLLAMQGPFSRKLNRVLLQEYKVDVMVSKASGSVGGLETKIKAAFDINIPVIIIKRPHLDYPIVFSDINKLICYCDEWEE